MKVVIIDYKAGNLLSVQNMLRKIGVFAEISCEKEVIKSADKLILPGVGHFDYGTSKLHELGLWKIIIEKAVNQKTPFLGICLGAQLLTQGSTEGKEKGLGLFQANTIRFEPPNHQIKIPHMGWREVNLNKLENPLFKDLSPIESRFYFVHSYHFATTDKTEILTTSNYGYDFVSALHKENIFGVQFHPEKSHKFGMTLLKNFINL